MWLPRIAKRERVVYRAIADALERDIAAGALAPGARLPTHRELADALGVNVNTVTRAYGEAERRGLLSAVVGRGTFVSPRRAENPEVDMPARNAEPAQEPVRMRTPAWVHHSHPDSMSR